VADGVVVAVSPAKAGCPSGAIVEMATAAITASRILMTRAYV